MGLTARGRGFALGVPAAPLFFDEQKNMRGKNSKIDLHPDRGRIEFDLARGVPVRRVAKKYGLHPRACYRYLKKLPPQLRASHTGKMLKAGADLEQLRIDESEGLLQNLASQRARLLIMQDAAMDTENAGLATQISGAIHKNIELTGRYLGEFASHQIRTEVSVLVQPQYLELRAALVRALAPFPEAKAAVAAVLHRIETKAAERPLPPMLEAKAETADAGT
jgi:hypothetical protein